MPSPNKTLMLKAKAKERTTSWQIYSTSSLVTLGGQRMLAASPNDPELSS